MRKSVIAIILCLSLHLALKGQEMKTKNLLIVTLDGMRWQEVFQGADSVILFNNHSKDKNSLDHFWSHAVEDRRAKLLPFFWNVIGTQGQLYGNRSYKNLVNCANSHWFS